MSITAWAAQDAAPAKEARPKLPPEVQAIVGLAFATPPEIAADALIRIAASNKIAERETRLQLIEQAFGLAASARDRLRLRHISGGAMDSREGMTDRAARLQMDALSLRTRAVRAVLQLDKAKAREMFGRLEAPEPQARSCEDSLVADVSDFYSLVAEITNQTFSAGERRLEQHVGFVRPFVLGVTSPVQAAPAARLVRTLSLTPSQRDLLLASYVTALQSIPADGRSFAATVNAADEEVRQLSETCRRDGLATDALKAAFDKYIEMQREAPRCASGNGAVDLGDEPSQATKTHPYWTSGEAQGLLAGGMKLRWGPSGVPERVLTLEDRKTNEWQAQLAETLNAVESWKPGPAETEADYFHQRCLLYETLVELTPPGVKRDNVIASFLGFLTNSSIQSESPAEWATHGLEILTRLRQSSDSDADRLFEAFLRSRSPALVLLARMERLIPRSPLPAPQ